MWSEVQEAGDAGTRKVLAVAGRMLRRQRTVLTVVPLAAVEPNPDQPRKHFADDRLIELAASIRDRGLLQPIVVRRHGAGYQLLAGERRYRAAHLAGLECLPAVVREGGDALEIALIENVQREDLAPLEEAEALAALIGRHSYSHREVANLLGKSRPYVSNTLSLNRLPETVKADLRQHGSAFSREVLMGIARQPDAATAVTLWNRLKLNALSVRRFRDQHATPVERHRPARAVALAARRLNRALARLEIREVSCQEVGLLRRALRRTRRLTDEVFGALDTGIRLPREPVPR